MTIAILIGLLAALATGPSLGNRPATPSQLVLQAQAAYTRLAASQAWAFFPAELCLRPGDTGRHVGPLRRNLALTGDLTLAGPGAGDRMDDTLVAAVKRYQQRHGLSPDGSVGPLTVAAMNVSPQQRLQQIALNLKRWRQIPPEAFPLVLVNIPDFTLQLLDTAQRVVWQTKVIVGQPARPFQTAQISSQINYLVLNPSWNIPKSIILREILPMLVRVPA